MQNNMTAKQALTVTHVAASIPAQSTCMPEDSGAVDIDVDVTLSDGRTLSGEVTLAPREYDGRLASFGAPDNWVSGALLRDLTRACGEDGLRVALNEIEVAALDAAE